MKFDREKDQVIFDSTGARTWTCCDIISIDENLDLATGMDCSFSMDLPRTNGSSRELTREERIELADHYIELWIKFRNTTESAGGLILQMKPMTDEQRLEIFHAMAARYCQHCGREQPIPQGRQCWNDI